MSNVNETRGLILSFNELGNDTTIIPDNDDPQYASSKEAFLNQSIFMFVVDEVHALMQILACELSFCATFYNPIYLALFILLFILTYPGALLHYLLLDFIPVRKSEMPEEREIRSQGIYTAIGVALISIPFAAVGLFLGDALMVLINEISLAVNTSIILTNLIGLKVIAEEYIVSVRVFIIGVWTIDVFLIGLALLDVYNYVTFSWISILDYFLRLVEIFVYTVIAVQSLQFWNLYDKSKSQFYLDLYFAIALSLLFLVVMLGFIVAIVISEDSAWRIMYF